MHIMNPQNSSIFVRQEMVEFDDSLGQQSSTVETVSVPLQRLVRSLSLTDHVFGVE